MDRSARLALPVLVLSCAVLGYEVSLMRVLLCASWHHFAFLVVTIALLGFGASGAALCFASRRLTLSGERSVFFLALATAVSLPLATAVAGRIPVEARFVPALFWHHAAWWILYWTVLSIPFFLGASAIGLSLIVAGGRLPIVYAANLVGSALGACLAPVAMRAFHPASLAVLMGAIAFVSALCVRVAWTRSGSIFATAAVIAGGALSWSSPREMRVDSFKYEQFVRQLIADGRARLVASGQSERSVVEVYSGDAFHEIAFLSVGMTPPPMLAITMDGHWAGSILRVNDASEAAVVDRTMMSLPYEFAGPKPAVLLLGETGGSNVWLAERMGASKIHVVQPDRTLLDIIRRDLHDEGGHVFDLPEVVVLAEDPRHFVQHAHVRYDLIEPSRLESWAVATGGIGGLRQDDLVTVEGLSACLERLAPAGILAICRALETPPSDNAKILATLVEALRRRGARDPAEHIVILRDYLAACTMVKASPWTASDVSKIREVCARRELTPVFFGGIREDELNHPDRLPGPPGERGDWLHHAAIALLSDRSRRFVREWPFDIRPPTDDRPFFENSGKLGSIGLLRQTYGDLWVTRTDLAFLFVLVASVTIAAWGALVTIVPVAFQTGVRRAPRRMVTALYFTAIGLGYLCVEITMLSRLNRLIGDPVLSGAVTIAGFLFFSGAGSLAAAKLDPSRAATVRSLIAGAAAAWTGVLLASATVATVAGALPPLLRIAASILVIAPLAFLMGFAMPSGLRRVEKAAPALVPWAWGVNGFASVLAPPLATAIGMAFGFSVAGITAVFLYVVAAVLYGRLPHVRVE